MDSFRLEMGLVAGNCRPGMTLEGDSCHLATSGQAGVRTRAGAARYWEEGLQCIGHRIHVHDCRYDRTVAGEKGERRLR